jgi:hypothetical protein
MWSAHVVMRFVPLARVKGECDPGQRREYVAIETPA